MSVLMEMEEIVETMEGVLVKMAEVGLGDSDGDTTIVDDRTCNKGERTVGERDRDDAETDMDTIAVGIKEGDKDEEGIIDDDSCKGLSSIVLSQFGSWELYAEAVGRKIDVSSSEMSWGSGKDVDCTEGEAARIGDS
jgi:hypothetical protein